MDVMEYCLSLEQDLGGWKRKLDDLRRMIEALGEQDRARMLSSVQEIEAFVARMSARLEDLKAECPTRGDEQTPHSSATDPAARTAP
jgi:hypothetical protein